MKFTTSALIISCVLFFLYFVKSETAAEPNILIHKSVNEWEAQKNSNITVSITLYNVGNAAAYDLKIKDGEWDAKTVKVLDGKLKHKLDKLDARASFTLKYVITPLELGQITAKTAKVSFAPAEKSLKIKKAFSQELPPIKVLTARQYGKTKGTKGMQWVIFFVLCLIPIGAPLFVFQYSKTQLKALLKKD